MFPYNSIKDTFSLFTLKKGGEATPIERAPVIKDTLDHPLGSSRAVRWIGLPLNSSSSSYCKLFKVFPVKRRSILFFVITYVATVDFPKAYSSLNDVKDMQLRALNIQCFDSISISSANNHCFLTFIDVTLTLCILYLCHVYVITCTHVTFYISSPSCHFYHVLMSRHFHSHEFVSELMNTWDGCWSSSLMRTNSIHKMTSSNFP